MKTSRIATRSGETTRFRLIDMICRGVDGQKWRNKRTAPVTEYWRRCDGVKGWHPHMIDETE